MIDDNKKSKTDTASENPNEYDQSKGGQATHEETSKDVNTEEESDMEQSDNS